jgi:serine/threonine protein kinase
MSTFLEPGTVIAGRYRLDHLLGEGGMGQVWAATHAVTLRTVALKFLKASSRIQPELRRRFVREARAASAVKHPNVVEIHDFFELEDGTPVMMMDLLKGETFGQRLAREHSLSLEAAAEILLPVTSAVGTAHSLGIVHRDLKPDNVFLCAGRHTEIKVLDFGIAKLTGADAAQTDVGNLTDTGAMLGTPCYMSPEQSFGEKDLDHRSDIWAIGVMLYEALSGTRPVEGENIGQVIKRLLNQGITPIEVLVPDLPADIAALVGRMLSRERSGRPDDLREVHDALAKYASVRVPEFGAAVSVRRPGDSNPSGPEDSIPARSARETPDPEADTQAHPSGRRTPFGGPQTQGAQSISVHQPTRRGAWMLGAGALVAMTALGALRFTSREIAGSGAAAAVTPSPPPAPIAAPREPVQREPSAIRLAAALPDAGPAAAPPRAASTPAPAQPHPGGAASRAEHSHPAAPVAPAVAPVAPLPAVAPSAHRAAPAPRSRGLVDEPPF